MNKFYTYFHINPLKNEIFYVGIGSGKRAYNKRERSEFWKDTVNKYGLIVNIVDEGLSWEEACIKEIHYIAKIGRRNLKLGPLVNLTNGGEGNYGLVVSEETKLKSSISHKGNKSALGCKHSKESIEAAAIKIKRHTYNKNRKHSEKSKSNMSKAHIGKGIGSKRSKETKEKMSIAQRQYILID